MMAQPSNPGQNSFVIIREFGVDIVRQHSSRHVRAIAFAKRETVAAPTMRVSALSVINSSAWTAWPRQKQRRRMCIGRPMGMALSVRTHDGQN
jgi:hypothetical protein